VRRFKQKPSGVFEDDVGVAFSVGIGARSTTSLTHPGAGAHHRSFGRRVGGRR
jgi:hypothetical protein